LHQHVFDHRWSEVDAHVDSVQRQPGESEEDDDDDQHLQDLDLRAVDDRRGARNGHSSAAAQRLAVPDAAGDQAVEDRYEQEWHCVAGEEDDAEEVTLLQRLRRPELNADVQCLNGS